jgi:RNA polymerase sigma factor (sigma-70 family)
MDVVRQVAASLQKRLPSDRVEVEELQADGFEALVKALRDHDPSRGPLTPYVIVRCRGAMLDGLRRRAWTSRGDRAEGASDAELLSLEQPLGENRRIADVVPIAAAEPAEEAVERAAGAELPVLADLPKQYQRVARARFLQRRSRRAVAEQEGVSPTTIAKLEARIRLRLRSVADAAPAAAAEQPLTAPELKVLRLAATGATAEETAKRLRKTRETVKSQRQMVIAKLCARNMINAVAIGYERGLRRPAPAVRRAAFD